MAQQPAFSQNASCSMTTTNNSHTVECTLDELAQILRNIPQTSNLPSLNQAVRTALRIFAIAQGGRQSFTALATDACKLVSAIALRYQRKSPYMSEITFAQLLRNLYGIAQLTEANTSHMTAQELGKNEIFYRTQLNTLWIGFERRFGISTHDIQGVLNDIRSSEKNDRTNNTTLYDGMNISMISGGVHTAVAGTQYIYPAPPVPSFPNAPAGYNPAASTALFHNSTISSSREKNNRRNNTAVFDGMNIPRISGGVHTVVAGTEYTYQAPTVPTSLPNAPADHNSAGNTTLFRNGTIGEISNGTFTAVGKNRVIVRIG